MADEKPTKVTVEALKFHTTAGQAYQIGDTYEVDESAVANLEFQGMAIRVDRVAHAKAVDKAAKKSTAVESLTLKDKAIRPSRGKKSRR